MTWADLFGWLVILAVAALLAYAVGESLIDKWRGPHR